MFILGTHYSYTFHVKPVITRGCGNIATNPPPMFIAMCSHIVLLLQEIATLLSKLQVQDQPESDQVCVYHKHALYGAQKWLHHESN